ncbi:putative reverse transcriptase domain-containing protein [Tanacetum coccineum]
MDFITKLTKTKSGHNKIWVIVDRLTKSAHFLAIQEDYSIERLARLYIDEMSLDTDERTTQTLEDMLRACVIDFGGNWDVHLPLVEFSYNNSYHSSIRCAPFEALYERKYRSPILWAKIGESGLIGLELVQETTNEVVLIKKKLKVVRDRQKSYSDNRRKPLEFEVVDKVLLKVSPWKGVMQFGKKGKLAPRYVGPFEILERIILVAYRLRLPKELRDVHDTFHVSNLKKCLADANLHVPLDEIKIDKNLHFVEKPVEIMDREVKTLKRIKSRDEISLRKGYCNNCTLSSYACSDSLLLTPLCCDDIHEVTPRVSILAGSSKGTKSQSKSSGKSVQAEEPMFEVPDIEMSQDQGGDLGNKEDQPIVKTGPKHDCRLAQTENPPLTFDELMSTPIDFSAYVMKNLKIDNLPQEILVGPDFNLLKGTYKSLVELEYNFEECYKVVTDRLDWKIWKTDIPEQTKRKPKTNKVEHGMEKTKSNKANVSQSQKITTLPKSKVTN